MPCRRRLLAPSAAVDAHGCACGAVPAPLLNTGFVYVRAAAAAGATSLPQLIYNRSVTKIMHRLARPPNHDAKGAVVAHARTGPDGQPFGVPTWGYDVGAVDPHADVQYPTIPVPKPYVGL